MKHANANVDLMQVFVIITKDEIKINADVNAKNWLTTVYAIKDLFGIQVIVNANVKKKSCDAGEYLDYKNCKCRKRLVDELVEIAGITLAEDENKHKNK